MEAAFARGAFPPYHEVLSDVNSLTDDLTDSEKVGRHFVQLAFLIRDKSGRVLVTDRVPHSVAAGHGHTTTLGSSVLVGWSPVAKPPLKEHPTSETEILWAFEREVREDSEPRTPRHLRFLGLIRNEVKGIIYWFYTFEVRYDGTPTISRLVKDRDDVIRGFAPVTPDLVSAIGKKKADLRSLELAGLLAPASFDPGSSRALAFGASDVAPWLGRPIGCFVSHASADRAHAEVLVERLEAAGISTWVYYRDIGLGEWNEATYLEAIRYCGSVVVVGTPAAKKAAGVLQEMEIAVARKTANPAFPIIAVVLEGSGMRDAIPDPVLPVQGLSLVDTGDRDARLARVIETLRRVMMRLGT